MAAKQPTGWVGWVYFASFMMLILGGLQALAGLVALFKDDYFVVGQNGVLAFSYTTWGWVNLVLGTIVFLAGLALMRGETWARVVACFLVVLSAMSNLAFFSAYPWWSIVGLIIDGFVLYALTVHGGEAKE